MSSFMNSTKPSKKSKGKDSGFNVGDMIKSVDIYGSQFSLTFKGER